MNDKDIELTVNNGIPKKQQYHLEPPYGLLNDPNGLAWFNDKLYVFFQWNRLGKDHSYKEWGLFTSADLINWSFKGTALLPDQIYDFKGIYSGSGLVIDDALHLFYTGNTNWAGHRRVHQSMAISEDGSSFIKTGPILETSDGFTEHFRDPKVWKGETGYQMVLGAQTNRGKGSIALCRSNDAFQFYFDRILGYSENFEMIECPDLFSLDGSHVLLYCPQRRDNEKDQELGSYSCYKICDYDEATGTLTEENLDENQVLTDFGFDFYAPQTTCLPDGRRLLIAWMSRMDEEQSNVFSEGEPRIHCLTLPRELSLENGKLHQRPIKELYRLLGEPIDFKDSTAYLQIRAWMLKIESKTPLNSFEIALNENEAKIIYSDQEHLLTFERVNWVSHKTEIKTVEISKLLNLEIWSDSSSLEVFVNSGEIVLSSRIFPEYEDQTIKLAGLKEPVDVSLRIIDKREE